MSSHSTEAVVLHAFDYLESSRIIKLLTRDYGLRSALARGARSSRKRFGAALDLFAQGSVELDVKPGRELDTLGSFDLIRTRSGIGTDLARFAGASALDHTVRDFAFRYESPEHFVEVFRMFYGPVLKAFAALDTNGQAALETDLLTLLRSSARTSAAGLVVGVGVALAAVSGIGPHSAAASVSVAVLVAAVAGGSCIAAALALEPGAERRRLRTQIFGAHAVDPGGFDG